MKIRGFAGYEYWNIGILEVKWKGKLEGFIDGPDRLWLMCIGGMGN